MGFDGTNKAEATEKVTIDYAKENEKIPSRQRLRKRILNSASEESLRILDLDEYRLSVEGDASTMTKEEWHARRVGNRALNTLGTIGASATSKIMGVCPYRGRGTNLDLYHEVLGDNPVIPDDEDEKREHLFLVGHQAEEYLQGVMEEYYPGCKILIDTRIFNDWSRKWMTTNLDFMMRLSDGAWVHGEFKTTNPYGAKAYDNDHIPKQYMTQLIQCQHLLNVDESRLVCAVMKPQIDKVSEEDMKSPKFDFGKFVDKIIIRSYIRNFDIEADQISACDDFWYNHVLPEIPPKVVGDEKQVNEAIRRWTGLAQPNDEVVELPSRFAENCKNYLQSQRYVDSLNEELKAAKKETEKYSAAIKQELGQHTNAVCVDPEDDGNVFNIEYKPTSGRVSFKHELVKKKNPKLYQRLIDCGFVIPAKEEAGRSFKIFYKNI